MILENGNYEEFTRLKFLLWHLEKNLEALKKVEKSITCTVDYHFDPKFQDGTRPGFKKMMEVFCLDSLVHEGVSTEAILTFSKQVDKAREEFKKRHARLVKAGDPRVGKDFDKVLEEVNA